MTIETQLRMLGAFNEFFLDIKKEIQKIESVIGVGGAVFNDGFYENIILFEKKTPKRDIESVIEILKKNKIDHTMSKKDKFQFILTKVKA